jgi:competence protein ComEC
MSELRHAGAPLAVLSAVVAGIAAGQRFGPAPARVVLVLALVFGGVAMWRRGRVGLVCAMLACGLLATGATQRALHGLAVSPIGSLAGDRAAVGATITLVGDPEPGRFDVRAVARVASLQAPEVRDGGRRLVIVTASRDVGSRLALLEAGDRVVVRGRLRPLQGYDARYRWRHVVARLTVREILHVSGPRSLLPRVANPVRHTVLAGTRFLPPTERALVSGFLVGDTRGVPRQSTDEFRAAGLSHLLAVSGENVAFVVAIAAPVLSRLRLRGRFLAGLAVLVVFGSMTRWEPSVLRAVAMAGVSMLAIFLGRPVPALRVLILAATALLLADPFLVHSVGFLLSCGACAGLVLVGRPLATRLRGPEGLRQPLAMTAAAQLGVLPIALSTFGSLPLVALPANLAVAPVVGPLTMAGLAGGAVGGLIAPWAPDLAELCQLPARLLVGYVEAVASVASRVPLALDGRSVWLALALSCAVGAIAVAVATRRTGSVRRRCPRSVSVTASTTSTTERS